MSQLACGIGALQELLPTRSRTEQAPVRATGARLIRLAFMGVVLFVLWGGSAREASAQCLPQDSCCGNGICDPGDDIETCPEDCFRSCGRGGCEPDKGENASNCPQDCFGCGDGFCDVAGGENSSTCAIDCGGCLPQGCNGRCGIVDDGCGNPLDCGTCSVCNNNGTCDPGEDTSNCAADCPPPVCNNNGTCDTGETEANCPNDCTGGGCTPIKPIFTTSLRRATTDQPITFTADSSTIVDPPTPLWDMGNAVHLSGASVTYPYPAAGTYNVILTASESACGTTQLSDPVSVTITEPGECDFTDIPPHLQVCCGNGTCDGGENPNSCSQDCPATCGDDLCTPGQGETADSCAVDCCFTGTTCDAGCAALPAFLMSNPTPAAFDLVTFEAFSSGIQGTTVNWDFGDGSHCEGCGLTVTHRYERIGRFEVRLTVTENVCGSTQVSFPQFISVGHPPARDSAQVVVATLPGCVQPQVATPVTVLVRNTGGTTWSRIHGQHLRMIEGDSIFAPSEVQLPDSVSVIPRGEWAFRFNLGTLGTESGEHTVVLQMANANGDLFGEPTIHRVRIDPSCAAPPREGDYTCRATVRTPEGDPVPNVQVGLEASAVQFGEDGKLEAILRAVDHQFTDVNGVAQLAVSKGGYAIHNVACRADYTFPHPFSSYPLKQVTDTIDVPSGAHIDLDLTFVRDYAPRAEVPGLRPGRGIARLYQSGAYDKVVVFPSPFNPDEQNGPLDDATLFRLLSPFVRPASARGYDVWLLNTKTGQNIHEQAAEFAQLIDVAAGRLGPDGTIIVAGYSLGGVTARLATARYQADRAWRIALGVRPQLPVRLIAFGDAPLAGANISYDLQHALWTRLSPNERPFPYSAFPQAMAKSNLNSCGAQQLLRLSYPTLTENFSRFWERGEAVRFPNLGIPAGNNPAGICDRAVGSECICDPGPALFTVNDGGWAKDIRLVAFSDGYPGPQACYGGDRDKDLLGRNVCEDNPGPLPYLPKPGDAHFRLAVPLASDDDLLARPEDVAPGSRLSNVKRVECQLGNVCGGVRNQYFAPTFIPLESALPAGAPFSAAWHADYQAVHGVGVASNIQRLLGEMDNATSAEAAQSSSRTAVTPLGGSSPSQAVTVTFPNILVPGDTTVTTSHDGPAPRSDYVLGSPGVYYDVRSTVQTAATVNDPIEVCIDYSGTSFSDEHRIELFHNEPVGWVLITSFRDTNADRICGNTTSLSPFAIFEPANHLPTVRVGADRTIEASGPEGATLTLSAAGSLDPDRESLSFEWFSATGESLGTGGVLQATLAIGQHEITGVGRDPRGGEGRDSVAIAIVDTTAPAVAVSVTGGRQRTVNVQATDAVGVISVQIEVDGVPFGEPLTAAPYMVSWDTTVVSDGHHTVVASARDAAGNVGRSTPVTVLVDNTPPSLTVSVSPSTLWPPSGKFVTIAAALSAVDAIDPAPKVRLESISCDDGCDVSADVAGATLGADDRGFALRARRFGWSDGRRYLITYSATDASGNQTTRVATVQVRHDMGRD